MLKLHPRSLSLTTLLAFALLAPVPLPEPALPQAQWLDLETEAIARRSGGRSGGGSFRRSAPSSSGSRNSGSSGGSRSTTPTNRSTSPSRTNSSGTNSTNSAPSRSNNNVIVAPGQPGYTNPGTGGSGGGFPFFILLLFGGVPAVFLFLLYRSASSGSRSSGVTATERERDNDIVTVTKLQVALLSTADGIQDEFGRISEEADTETSAGLWQLLQEAVLLIQRHEEHWSHALASSEKFKIDEAETAFNKLCFRERSKFSHESFVHVNGELRERAAGNGDSDDGDLGSYIVVTLLVGTANDRPLFDSVHSTDELTAALGTLASLPDDYLMTFYLLWTPEESSQGLTYNEMLSEYTEMYQLA